MNAPSWLPTLHLRDAELEGAARAGALTPRARRHLETCVPCRAAVQVRREIVAGIASLEGPVAGEALRARIHAQRAAGARVILPADVPTSDRRAGRRWAGVAAAAALALFLGTQLVGTRDADAGVTSGSLSMQPALPGAGDTVTVRYVPPALLSRHDVLSLRARIRFPGDPAYNVGRAVAELATLRRDGDAFTGTFVLPAGAVFGVLAVEDPAATLVDDNDGRGWEVLLRGRPGVPTLEALDQRAQDLMGRNWEEGFVTVRRMAAEHPDDIRAWSWLYTFQRWLGQGEMDSVRTVHRERLREFEVRAARTSDGEVAGRLAWYARGLDSSIAARWQERLMREHPTNSFAVQWRLFALLDTLRVSHDTARILTRLEALWAEAPADRRPQVASYVVGIVSRGSDRDAILRWHERTADDASTPRENARWIATRLAQLPLMRDEGIRRLRAEIDSLDAMLPAERRLDETVTQHRERRAARSRQLLASLGRALVVAGDREGGLDALARASASGWDLNVLRAVHAAALAAGDTSRALAAAARVIADPRTPAAFTDSLARLVRAHGDTTAWREMLAVGRRDFVERLLAQARPRSLRGAVRLADLEGRSHDLAALTGGRVSVVAIWSRFCGPAVDQLPALATVGERLSLAGVPLVSILEEATPSADLAAFLDGTKLPVPSYLDAGHSAGRAFNQWGTPALYVLGSDGRVYFDATSSPEDALAYAMALVSSQGTASN